METSAPTVQAPRVRVDPDAVLPEGWDCRSDVVLIAGEGGTAVAEPFVAHGTQRVIVYLPQEGIVINADMYNPAAPGTTFPDFRLPNMRVLAENIERLGLDVEQHVGLHGQVGSHDEFLRAIGGN